MVNLDKIREDLAFLKEREVVLFGSFVTGNSSPRSDVDIAIISRLRNRDKMMDIRIKASGQAPEGYDIQVFEALPLIIRGSILEGFKVLFGDPLEIGMYLYYERKLWDDFRYRIEIPTIEEIQKGTIEIQE